jgi:hypothetical protein
MLTMHAIEPEEFKSRWREWYPDAAPHGWAMGEAYPYRWFRIHSLPGSKRLPEREEDYVTVLARQNTVVDAIIGTAECVLIGYDYAGAYDLPANHLLAEWLPDAPPVMRLAPEDEDSEATSLFAARMAWYDGMLDPALRAVADDQLRLLLLNWETGAAYAPYDGGADLFLPSEHERDRVREHFKRWLPPDPSGM